MTWPPPVDGDSMHLDGAPALNERDLELLRHLAAGSSTSQIALAMSVTSNTARTRIRRIQRKLGVRDRGQAAEAARDL